MNGNKKVILKGSTIFSSKPFAFMLNSEYRTELCDHCFEGGNLLRCSGCQYVYYCNHTCQKKAWQIHKKECKNLKQFLPITIPNFVRLMSRIIMKLSMGGSNEMEYTGECLGGTYRKFEDLMTHTNEVANDIKRMEHFTSVCFVLLRLVGKEYLPDTSTLMNIYGRICVNSFSIMNADMNGVGTGIYLGPSILDHSCKPNAAWVFSGTTLHIRALIDIPYEHEADVRIAYIDLLDTTAKRRKSLQDIYYFWCTCQKCEEPDPEETAAACPNSTCSHPINSNDQKCSKCGHIISSNFLNTFTQVNKFIDEHKKELDRRNNMELFEECMEKQKGVLHPFNVKYVQVIESAFETAISLAYWEKALNYALLLIPGYLKYYTKFYPVTGLLFLQLGKIQLYLGKSEDALKSLNECKAILAVTHGTNHPVYSERLVTLFS